MKARYIKVNKYYTAKKYNIEITVLVKKVKGTFFKEYLCSGFGTLIKFKRKEFIKEIKLSYEN